ncbi:MAG: BON domain-containing protein [Nitrospirae bacterium]|nr:BON domain-containing protein [Candidatus Manganitrophaceae bacterium]
MKRLILLFLFIAFVGSGCSTTHPKERAGVAPSNKAIEAQVRAKLKSDPLTAPWEITPHIEGNNVTLTGLVEKEEERRRAEDVTRQIVGELRKVNNQIVLTDEVVLDKSIIAKLSTELITNPVTRLANIEVQSNKGVVKLNGLVKTDEQKREAERLATTTAGVKSVENNLRVGG